MRDFLAPEKNRGAELGEDFTRALFRRLDTKRSAVCRRPRGIKEEDHGDRALRIVREPVKVAAIKRAWGINGVVTFPVPEPQKEIFVQAATNRFDEGGESRLGWRKRQRIEPERAVSARFRLLVSGSPFSDVRRGEHPRAPKSIHFAPNLGREFRTKERRKNRITWAREGRGERFPHFRRRERDKIFERDHFAVTLPGSSPGWQAPRSVATRAGSGYGREMATPGRTDYADIRRKYTALLGTPASRARTPWETKLTSLIALLREGNSRISWVGAYLERPPGSGVLWVDAYQGNVACLEIPIGKGVCGTAFARGEVLTVPDVDQFPGHIACDASTRSEIVFPLHRGTELVGVLDLDSHELAAFDANDAAGIGVLLAILNG